MTGHIGERACDDEIPNEDVPRYTIAGSFRIFNRRLAWMLLAQAVLIVALLKLL
jgi:hypothetical protein